MKSKTKKEKPLYSTVSNILFVLGGLLRYDRNLIFWLIANVIFSAASRIIPVFMPKLIIDKLTSQGSAREVIILSAIFAAAVFITNAVSQMSNVSIGCRMISARLRFIIRSGEKFMATDFQNLENPDILDLSQKGDRATSNNQEGIEGVMHQIQSSAHNLLTLIGSVTVISIMGPELLIAIILLLSVNYAVSHFTRKKDKEENDKLAPLWRRINYLGDMTSDFTFAKDIRLFGLKSFLMGRYRNEQEKIYDGRSIILRLWRNVRYISSLTALIQEIILYAWLCMRMLSGAFGIGSFLMYITSIGTFTSALDGLADNILGFQQQSRLICDFRAFLDIKDIDTGSKIPPQSIQKEGAPIEFKNVSFRYPGREEYALKNLCLTIKPFEKLAVVGLNGAGKTTFVKLLMRLYRPESGSITLNGTDIGEYSRDEYYKLFSAVFQEIHTFAFTLAENISMSEYEKTDFERVKACLEQAGLKEKLDSLEKGLDTPLLKVIDEGGVELSGGENQKLALAKALYKDAPFIVLDEPTAALDSLAEERLYKEFDRLTRKKTAIYISHRLASTRFCDRILMFENGSVIESGSHEELIEKNGKYAGLFNVQARYYRQSARAEETAV